MGYKRPVRILFLCTGNSCRSQIAEGFANALGKGKLLARSAGIEAHGKNPRAIEIMLEVGIDISDQESEVVTDEMLSWADLVITVCGHADVNCPVVLPHAQKKHLPFDDPAQAEGTEEQIMHAFRNVREQIRESVEGIVGGISLWEKTST